MEKFFVKLIEAITRLFVKKVSATTLDISNSTTLMPERKYGAWFCINTGTAAAKVMGYDILPGEGLNFLNAVSAGSSWDTPIQIIINPGAVVRITRLQCTNL